MLLRSVALARSCRYAVLACCLASAPLAATAAAVPDGGESASVILHRAEDQARAEHKNILLEFGASWCVNCRLYDRFLADPRMHALMSRAFVFVTMDTGESPKDKKHANTPGGVDFEDSVGGKDAGWPFLVILNASGRPVVDSDRPDAKAKTGKSNIGYPFAPEEIDWFVEMLRRGAPSLNAEDRGQVHAWLAAFASGQRH
ncbi:MAG TPA: thioredoxin family protein [Acidobacteriaceae bacterium]|nr:thioredoxin family protein [Acidobacteriaceae bacterium]